MHLKERNIYVHLISRAKMRRKRRQLRYGRRPQPVRRLLLWLLMWLLLFGSAVAAANECSQRTKAHCKRRLPANECSYSFKTSRTPARTHKTLRSLSGNVTHDDNRLALRATLPDNYVYHAPQFSMHGHLDGWRGPAAGTAAISLSAARSGG